MTIGLLAVATTATAYTLTLDNGETTLEVPVEEIGTHIPSHRFALYDPYQGETVEMQGVIFRDFLMHHWGEVPPALHFTAWDDYKVTLSGWSNPNWYLITHENGAPITLRERGPLRLVERDYGDRDTSNLRAFNDWVWMIRRIEALW
ncbi:hypothetical protein ACU6TU_06940 [Halomonas sp. LS-001]